MRNTVFIGMACVFLSACGVDVAERIHVVDSPVDTSDGLPVEGTTVPKVIPPRLTGFEATASKTPNDEGNRVQEAQAAQGTSRRIPLSPADEQKGLTVPGSGRASVPAVSSSPGLNARAKATASKTPNDEGNRVQEAQAAQGTSRRIPLSPADEQKGLTVPGSGRASVPAVSSSPGLNARAKATASKTPNDEGNRVQEAQAAQGTSRRIPLSPADEQKGLTVPGSGRASVPAVSSSPGLNARAKATASKTPNDEGNRVQEAQAAQGTSRRIPLSPADEQKGLTVPGSGRASVPAVSSSPGLNARAKATASKTPNDEGNRVQEAQAAQGTSRRIPLSPADEQKGLTVPGSGRASVPAVSSSPGLNARSKATASQTPNDEGNRVQEAQAAQGASRRIPLSPA